MPIDVRELIEKMEWAAANDLRALRLCIGGIEVRMRRSDGVPQAPLPDRPLPATPAAGAAPQTDTSGDAGIVQAPLAGMCHLGPEAGSQAFVTVGDTVTEGQTLCVIEAMKVMTSIPSPRSGTVEEILASDGTSVAVGDPLMRLT